MDTIDILRANITTFIDKQDPAGKSQSTRKYENWQAWELCRFLYDGSGKISGRQTELLLALLQTRHLRSLEDRAFAITRRLPKINHAYGNFEIDFFKRFDVDSKKSSSSDTHRNLYPSEIKVFAEHWHEIFVKENCIWHGWIAECFHELKKKNRYGDPQQDMLQYIFDLLP